MNVLLLTKYGCLGASSRMRSFQYLSFLAENDVNVDVDIFIDDQMMRERYKSGRYRLLSVLGIYLKRICKLVFSKNFDLILIEKEALPWLPVWFELFFLRKTPFVLDYDDAVFHYYDLRQSYFIRSLFGRRLDALMAKAALVIGGNEYLAQRARDAGSKWVEILPTVIDLERYPKPNSNRFREQVIPVVVWIGSPSTVHYLKLLHTSLQELALRQPFVLRVIGGDLVLPGVQVECIQWSESSEVASIAACDVGVMPLLDSPWERGKCGYKLIQYMACGLPVVASPVGVNTSIVQDGINGFLADSDYAWTNRLEQLLTDANLRSQMGSAGRRRVEQEYCLQVTRSQLLIWLRRAAQKKEE